MEMGLEETERGFDDELEVAVKAVRMACSLCQTLQERLIAEDDVSLVTVAGWSVRVIVSWVLSNRFGEDNVSTVAEEDTLGLREAEAEGALGSVVEAVNECLGEAWMFGLEVPKVALGMKDVVEAISRCNSVGGAKGRFWVLNPVDGTKGFVRGDQFAVALALVEDGEVVLGVLGCPYYPMGKGWLNYQHRYYRLVCKLTRPSTESWDKGCVFYARRGSCKAWMQPMVYKGKIYSLPNFARRVRTSPIVDPAMATFCEPFEKASTSHSFTTGLAQSACVRKEPLRVYNMLKYAAIARGDAEIFMKSARTGYKEKIWDHAAGVVIIQEAGGVVTDTGGNPLDFSRGIYVEGLDRGIIACANPEMHYKIVQAVDASFASSCL